MKHYPKKIQKNISGIIKIGIHLTNLLLLISLFLNFEFLQKTALSCLILITIVSRFAVSVLFTKENKNKYAFVAILTVTVIIILTVSNLRL